MNSTVEELGKLKYSLDLVVSLEEIKPTYNAIYRKLKNTKLNGFRPGKHPKGWLDKRFTAAMQQEAINMIIPGYMEDALQEHSLRPITQPTIHKIDFDRKSPLSATVHFEIAPDLPQPNYERIQLERKNIGEVTEKNISEEIETLIQREEQLEPKVGEHIKVEKDDWVSINYEGTINGKKFANSTANTVQLKIGSSELEEFHSGLMGMISGDEKDIEIVLPERFGKNAGKKAIFKINLTEIFSVKRPEMDADFFKKYGVVDEKELRKKVSENIKSRKAAELQSEYRILVRTQLFDLYDEFILPEALVKYGEDQVSRELEQASSEKEIPKEEKEKRREEGIKNAKMDLRMKIILDSISDFEELQFDNNEVAREFVQLAQIAGQSPDELIKSPFGNEMYERISVRKKGDATLDRIVARVFGDPIEKLSSKNLEHVHNENCEHDHS